MEGDSVSFVSEYELKGKMLTGCVIPGFGVTQLSGLIILACVLLYTTLYEITGERERVRPGGSPFPEQKRRDQPTQSCLP